MGREDPDPTRERADDEDFGGPVRYGLIAFLVALALLNAQVTVTRLLAYRFFYHFVFFVISLSQLGLAAAGAWVYASRRLPRMNLDLLRWLLLLAASPLLVLAAYSWLGPRPNLSFGKLDGPTAYGYLSLLAILLVVLNFAGGMVLTTLFTGFKEHIGRLYAADLVGASLGCLASVGLMMYAGPIRAFLMSGVAALLAALGLLILLEGKGRRPSQSLTQPRLVSAWVFLVLFLCLGLAFPGLFDPNLRFPDRAGRLTRSAWTHIARTDATGPASYVIDGDAYTEVYSGLPQGGVDPPSPSYELVSPGPDVAIIGVGAGPQLVVALERGATSVLAVDINPTIIAWSKNEDRQFNQDIFNRPEVTVQVAEGRHALRSSENDFDLIVMHAIDTWTASSQGAYSLTENFLYTSEAMRDLLSKLRPGGVVSIRRWLFWPPRESLRLFTTINDALEREGFEEPERHLIALSPEQQFRDPELKVWGFVFFSNQPFGEEQLARLDRYVESRHWSYLYRPGESIPTPFTEFLYASDRQAFYDPYPYIVTPASDANPFFFQLASPWVGLGIGRDSKALGCDLPTELLASCSLPRDRRRSHRRPSRSSPLPSARGPLRRPTARHIRRLLRLPRIWFHGHRATGDSGHDALSGPPDLCAQRGPPRPARGSRRREQSDGKAADGCRADRHRGRHRSRHRLRAGPVAGGARPHSSTRPDPLRTDLGLCGHHRGSSRHALCRRRASPRCGAAASGCLGLGRERRDGGCRFLLADDPDGLFRQRRQFRFGGSRLRRRLFGATSPRPQRGNSIDLLNP